MALVTPLSSGLRMCLQFTLLNNTCYCRSWYFQGFSLVSRFAVLLTAHIDLISVFSISISVLPLCTHRHTSVSSPESWVLVRVQVVSTLLPREAPLAYLDFVPQQTNEGLV